MKTMIRKGIPLILAAACLCSPVSGTSIVIDFERDRIVLLADSHATLLNPDGNASRHDKCKISMLGEKFAFAETGNEGYKRASPVDTVPEWNGISEAREAYSVSPDHDLYKVSLEWAIRVTNNFQRFYLSNAPRVRSLTGPGATLLVGIFAGSDSEGRLRVYIARIALDDTLPSREPASIPIGYAIDELAARVKPYSTNAITQELVDGKSTRSKEVARLWQNRPHKTRLRWLEFLIERTGDYDIEVGLPVNTIQVARRSTTWLKITSCKSPVN